MEITVSVRVPTAKPCRYNEKKLQNFPTNPVKFPVGLEWRGASTWLESTQSLHRFIGMCSAVGGRYAVRIFGGSYCQWPLLHFHDGDIRLARKCCGLRNIRPMASSGINGGLLGTAVWHDVDPASESVANSDGLVRCGIHCLRCNVGILRCCIPSSSAVYAACAQSERRGSQRREDRPGGIRYY